MNQELKWGTHTDAFNQLLGKIRDKGEPTNLFVTSGKGTGVIPAAFFQFPMLGKENAVNIAYPTYDSGHGRYILSTKGEYPYVPFQEIPLDDLINAYKSHYRVNSFMKPYLLEAHPYMNQYKKTEAPLGQILNRWGITSASDIPETWRKNEPLKPYFPEL